MPFFKLSESEIREISKKHIESLEYWLRRVIHNSLSNYYGEKYWLYRNENEIYIIKKDIREKVSNRLAANGERFSRWIDATLLEHLIDIICKQNLYELHFKPFFESNFPLGREQLRFYLKNLSETRNRLYHVNPISIRQAEQAVCYSNDIIEAIKYNYLQLNRFMDFNAPSILSVTLSNGEKYYRQQMIKASNGVILNLRNSKFRCGDRIKIELEIDSSFEEDEYTISWQGINAATNSRSVDFEFKEQHVGEVFKIVSQIRTNKNWHRYNRYDDKLSFLFTILPPI